VDENLNGQSIEVVWWFGAKRNFVDGAECFDIAIEGVDKLSCKISKHNSIFLGQSLDLPALTSALG